MQMKLPYQVANDIYATISRHGALWVSKELEFGQITVVLIFLSLKFVSVVLSDF